MITEICPHCNNTVVGQFNPSNTRKYLTGLAKSGGMKAVLAAVGSVVPGFGNVAGFLAGGALDLIYGDDIKKFIDKVADEFDDNKVYVFDCPQCGHSWAKKEEEIGSYNESNSTASYGESYTDSEINFDTILSNFLDRIGSSAVNSRETEILSDEMSQLGKSHEYENPTLASRYYYLAGLCDLIYARDNYNTKRVARELKRASKSLRKSCKLDLTDENKLVLSAVDTLRAPTPEECVKEGSIETAYYTFNETPIFKEDWLIPFYEECRFLSILKADEIITDAEEGIYDDKLWIDLWTSGLNLQNINYRMISHIELYYLYEDTKTSTGKLSTRCAKNLNSAFETEGYDIESCDVNNFFCNKWSQAYVYFAISILEDRNPYVSKDTVRGWNMLERAIRLDDCFARDIAAHTLGMYYENGYFVSQDFNKALEYYSMLGETAQEEVERVRTKIHSNSTMSSSSKNYNEKLSSDEEEYLTEYRACLEEDGVITDRERRLLDRIRKSLGISEERTRELEESCSAPSLPEEEQEYADEIMACLEEDGKISDRERRLLNKLRVSLGISEERAKEIEALLK